MRLRLELSVLESVCELWPRYPNMDSDRYPRASDQNRIKTGPSGTAATRRIFAILPILPYPRSLTRGGFPAILAEQVGRRDTGCRI